MAVCVKYLRFCLCKIMYSGGRTNMDIAKTHVNKTPLMTVHLCAIKLTGKTACTLSSKQTDNPQSCSSSFIFWKVIFYSVSKQQNKECTFFTRQFSLMLFSNVVKDVNCGRGLNFHGHLITMDFLLHSFLLCVLLSVAVNQACVTYHKHAVHILDIDLWMHQFY